MDAPIITKFKSRQMLVQAATVVVVGKRDRRSATANLKYETSVG